MDTNHDRKLHTSTTSRVDSLPLTAWEVVDKRAIATIWLIAEVAWVVDRIVVPTEVY